MTEELDSRIGRAIHLTLKRHLRDHPDLIAITEAVKSVVSWEFNMATEESGIMTANEDTLQQLAWNVKSMSTEVPAKRAEIQSGIPPAPRSSVQAVDKQPGGLIVMPGDPEFAADVAGPRGDTKTISALSFRKKGSGFREKKEIQYWDPAELIDLINQNTPERVEWETIVDGEPRKLIADRNTINQVVEKNVVLTYKHPAVSNSPSTLNVNDLTARRFFSCYTEEHDVDAAMKDIMAQLHGLYKQRSEKMEPNSGPEPAALTTGEGASLAMRGSSMKDSYGAEMQPGYRSTADPYSDTILNEFKQTLKAQNKVLTPSRRD